MARAERVEYRHEARFADVLGGLDEAERDALLDVKATTLVLDAGRILEHYGADTLERAIELLLEDLDPVLIWWAQRPECAPLTIWWSQRPHKVESFTRNDPLWLAFCSTGGRFADRALRVVQKTRAFMTAEMSVKPLADGMKLKAAMLGSVLHIFANEDAQGVAAPPETAKRFVDRISTGAGDASAPDDFVSVHPSVARACMALGADVSVRVRSHEGEQTWEATCRRRCLRLVVRRAGLDLEGAIRTDDLRRLAAIPDALCRAGVDDRLPVGVPHDWPWPSPGAPSGSLPISTADLAVLHGVAEALPDVEGWRFSGLGRSTLAVSRGVDPLLAAVELVLPAL